MKKAWKAIHFTIRIFTKGNSNTKSLACTSLVLPILEYGAACWDPCRKGQINALHRVKNMAAETIKDVFIYILYETGYTTRNSLFT
jgi:hypothetical protein